MRFISLFAVSSLLAIGTHALAFPKTVLEGENGIIVEDDGSTKIDGETGITVNPAGQTTNVGGSAGITITPDPVKPAPANSSEAASNSTSNGTAELGALITTLNDGSGKKNGTANGTATVATANAGEGAATTGESGAVTAGGKNSTTSSLTDLLSTLGALN